MSAIVQNCWMSPPSTHGPAFFTTTAPGPIAQLPVSAVGSVAVGSDSIGPTPQMIFPGVAGVR